MGTPKIFDYKDYREFLEDILFIKSQQPNWTPSFAMFYKKANGLSKGYLTLKNNQKPYISLRILMDLGNALELSNRELCYFETLVNFNHAANATEQKQYDAELEQIRQ
jgi:uncharacterized protein (TIGR02147 family)